MRKQSPSLRFVLVAGLALAGILSQAAPAAADADPKVTQDLVQMVTPQDTYEAMINTMTKQMMASMAQSGAKIPPDAETKMAAAVKEALPYKDLVTWTVEIYGTRFTTEEIRELIKFYKTPVGKKAAKLIPEISGEVGKKLGPIMMQRLPAAMKKDGLAP
jgi:hypothetical protein